MPTISIASLVAPTSVGGLAAYQQQLAAALQATASYHVNLLALGDPVLARGLPSAAHHRPVEMVPGRAALHAWKPLLSRLASRPRFLPLLRVLVRQVISPSNLAQSLSTSQALHFVGTGWDYMGFSLVKAARLARIRFTIWPAVHPLNWGDDKIDISLYREADSIFCQSDYEKRHLHNLGLPLNKLVRCGLPPMCRADGNGERLRQSLGIADRVAVLFVGRRDTGKGYSALLDAWPLVLQQCPDAVLLLAGPGDPDPSRLARINSDSVRDLGCPDERLKADAFSACDVFCLPSTHESFGIVYVEAWSYGKPVVCGTAPASRELVDDGVTGIWADQEPQHLAGRLVQLLSRPELRQQLGAAGLRHQRLNYTDEKLVESHLNAWRAPSFN